MKDSRTFDGKTGAVSFGKKNKFLAFVKKHLKLLIIIAVLLIPLLLMFIPIRSSIDGEDIDKSREWYVVRFITGETDGGCYITDCGRKELIGDRVYFDGEIPSAPIDYLTSELKHSCDNRYVVYGKMEKETETAPSGEAWERYMLKMDGWEIFGDIKTVKGDTKSYLTVYDYTPLPFLGEYDQHYHSVHISDLAKNGVLDDHTYTRSAV